jgi:hypothetical protein
MKKRGILGVVACAAFAVMVLIAGCGNKDDSKKSETNNNKACDYTWKQNMIFKNCDASDIQITLKQSGVEVTTFTVGALSYKSYDATHPGQPACGYVCDTGETVSNIPVFDNMTAISVATQQTISSVSAQGMYGCSQHDDGYCIGTDTASNCMTHCSTYIHL